ncbi:hypothetical protein [Microbispora amethystogenes]|uniref:Uncharacterized protein n=1 Tax=Microbispora amethystogenes TaxID=1427754 RepID=A0ABQ4FP11_9ACTN|nr:hypothetical protein [Microbispora amethystogenes]GIH36532.1 hypothetical protein Mam01_66960 [Microbispora amethystogenes]
MTSQRTYTHPDVFGKGVEEGWADPCTDPREIDWAARQARAAIPFRVVDGRPVNPYAPTGIRYGRNELGHWGEQVAADAVVTATDEYGFRWLVMASAATGTGGRCRAASSSPERTRRQQRSANWRKRPA